LRVRIWPQPATRQYARLVSTWISSIGLGPAEVRYSLLEADQSDAEAAHLARPHEDRETTVYYLGIEIDDAIAIADKIDV
jgi:hypothetical protein